MSLSQQGVLHKKEEIQNVTASFSKREFVIKTGGDYPQLISFQLTQDRCSILDAHQLGDTINVLFDLRGREWTSPKGEVRYFNTLNAWKIDKLQNSNPPVSENFPNASSEPPVFSETDDLPF